MAGAMRSLIKDQILPLFKTLAFTLAFNSFTPAASADDCADALSGVPPPVATPLLITAPEFRAQAQALRANTQWSEYDVEVLASFLTRSVSSGKAVLYDLMTYLTKSSMSIEDKAKFFEAVGERISAREIAVTGLSGAWAATRKDSVPDSIVIYGKGHSIVFGPQPYNLVWTGTFKDQLQGPHSTPDLFDPKFKKLRLFPGKDFSQVDVALSLAKNLAAPLEIRKGAIHSLFVYLGDPKLKNYPIALEKVAVGLDEIETQVKSDLELNDFYRNELSISRHGLVKKLKVASGEHTISRDDGVPYSMPREVLNGEVRRHPTNKKVLQFLERGSFEWKDIASTSTGTTYTVRTNVRVIFAGAENRLKTGAFIIVK